MSTFPKADGAFGASVVVVAEFAGDEDEVVGHVKFDFGGSAGLVPDELCPPVPKMSVLAPNPVPNGAGFDGASDVAVLGV